MAQFDLISGNQTTDTLRRVRNLQLAVALTIGVIGLAILLVVLLLVDRRMRSDLVRIEETLVQIEERMATVGEPLPNVQELNAEIARVHDLRISVESLALPPNIDWPQVVATIRNYDQQLIHLMTLVQTDDRITLEGHAASNLVVVDYAQRLGASPLFIRVDVQSIRTVRTTAIRSGAFIRPPGLAKIIRAPQQQTEEEQEVQFVLTLVLDLAAPAPTTP